MGIYDDITFEVPLPCEVPPELAVFQTKDLDCNGSRYRVGIDGQLYCGTTTVYDSVIAEFCGSNWVGSAHGVSFTKDGSDLVSIDGTATFDKGILQSLTAVKTLRPALARAELDRYPHFVGPEFDLPETFIGLKLFTLDEYEIAQDGLLGTCIAEKEHHIVIDTVEGGLNGEFSVHHKFLYGRSFFLSVEDAVTAHSTIAEYNQRTREHFQKLLDANKSPRINFVR